MKEERVELDKKYNDIRFASDTLDKDSLLADLEKTLYASKICAYAQGFNLIGTAGEVYGWHLNLGHLAKIWRNGCIIRAAFLNVVSDSFDSNPSMKNLLFSDFFASALKEARPGWGRIVSWQPKQAWEFPLCLLRWPILMRTTRPWETRILFRRREIISALTRMKEWIRKGISIRTG